MMRDRPEFPCPCVPFLFSLSLFLFEEVRISEGQTYFPGTMLLSCPASPLLLFPFLPPFFLNSVLVRMSGGRRAIKVRANTAAFPFFFSFFPFFLSRAERVIVDVVARTTDPTADGVSPPSYFPPSFFLLSGRRTTTRQRSGSHNWQGWIRPERSRRPVIRVPFSSFFLFLFREEDEMAECAEGNEPGPGVSAIPPPPSLFPPPFFPLFFFQLED